ncbi:MAG: YceI family protein [Bacteroidota bacterium]
MSTLIHSNGIRKKSLALLCLIGTFTTANAQLYKNKAEAGIISFFSKAPLEDIDATNKKATIVLKTTTNEIQFGVAMLSFKFPKPLMEEHFNENYVESEKYPTATFKGKISETIDYTKDGEYKVTVKGTMDMHGVAKEIEVPGTLSIKGTNIMINANFKIKVADYKIKVPSMYVQNIAEEVDVKVIGTLEPFTIKK